MSFKAALYNRVNDWKYYLSAGIGNHPGLYYPLFARSYPFNQMAVQPQTRICIEGFPRSANSYAVVAFKLDNPEVKVGHHLHVAAQIIRAVELKIPTVIVLRSPLEAVASFLVFQSTLRADIYLKSYIDFHTRLKSLQTAAVTARFETVTADFNQVIIAVNKKYDTQFRLIADLENRQEEIFSKLKKVNNQFFAGQSQKNMFPDSSRVSLKERARKAVQESPFLEPAQQIYETLKKQSV